MSLISFLFKEVKVISELKLTDNRDPRQTTLFQLSKSPGLEFFSDVQFVASPQDYYVPYHSARVEMDNDAIMDPRIGKELFHYKL